MVLQKNEWSSKTLIAFIIAFLLYVFASSVFITELPYSVIIVFSILPFLVLDCRKSISFTFFLLPFSWYFPGYIILLVFILLIFKSKGDNRSIQFSFTIILVILEILHLLLSSFPVEWSHALSPLVFIALFFYLIFFPKGGVEESQCIKLYCISACFAVLLSYLMIIHSGGFDLFILGTFRSGMTLNMERDSVILNSNSAAFLSLTSFVCLLYSKDKLGLSNLYYIIFLLFSFTLGILSFSRTFLLLVSFALFAYFIIERKKKKYKTVLACLLFVIIAGFCIPSVFDAILNVFSARLTSYDINNAGGRTEIFMQYNRWLLDNPEALIWGTGINYYQEITDVGHATHCGLQQILVCTGIIGLILFFIAAKRYYSLYRTNTSSLQAMIPFFICVAFDQSIQFLMPQFLMFPFVVTAYLFRIISLSPASVHENN